MEQCGSRSVQEVVAYAVNALILGRTHVLPTAVAENLVQRDAVSSAAPGGDEHIRVGLQHTVGAGLGAGLSDEDSTCGIDEFGDPGLRSDQRLAPFFTEDARPRSAGCALTNCFYGSLHLCDDFLSAIGHSHDSGDGGYVSVDVVQVFRRETQKAGAGFHDFRNGFFLIGNGGYDKVGTCGENLVGMGSPGVG